MGSEWVDCELGDVVELKRGYDLPKAKRVEGKIPVISSSGESGCHDESKVSAPGVVTGRYGTIGEVFYLENDFWPLNTTLYVKNFKGNDPLFVYYFLKTISYSDYTDKAAVPGINRNHIHKAKVRVPADISLQKEISRNLYLIDQKITLNRQINQTLEQMAQALFKSWFVDFDPVIDNALAAGNPIPDELQPRAEQRKALRLKANGEDSYKPLPESVRALFPDAFEESELGWVPEGWQVSTTGDELTVKGGSTPSTKNPEFWENGDIHWTSPKDLSGQNEKIMLDTDRKITEAGLKKITSGLLPPETVLMSSRAPIGYLALTKIPVAVNQGYIAIPETKRLTQEYVLYWLDGMMDEIKGVSGGTTFSEISKKTFKSIAMLVPDKDCLGLFSQQVSGYLKKIELNVREQQSLEHLRDTLLPKLISGELQLDQLPDVVASVA